MAGEKITNLVNQIGELTVIELSELVKAVEEKFGVVIVGTIIIFASGGGCC